MTSLFGGHCSLINLYETGIHIGLGYRVAIPGGVQISKAFVGKGGASLKMYHRLQQQLRGWCGKVTMTRATAVEGGVLRTRWASWEMKRTSETTRGCVLAGPRPEAGEEAALALVLSSCLAVRHAQKLTQDCFTERRSKTTLKGTTIQG